jgi:hypothetical protein
MIVVILKGASVLWHTSCRQTMTSQGSECNPNPDKVKMVWKGWLIGLLYRHRLATRMCVQSPTAVAKLFLLPPFSVSLGDFCCCLCTRTIPSRQCWALNHKTSQVTSVEAFSSRVCPAASGIKMKALPQLITKPLFSHKNAQTQTFEEERGKHEQDKWETFHLD